MRCQEACVGAPQAQHGCLPGSTCSKGSHLQQLVEWQESRLRPVLCSCSAIHYLPGAHVLAAVPIQAAIQLCVWGDTAACKAGSACLTAAAPAGVGWTAYV